VAARSRPAIDIAAQWRAEFVRPLKSGGTWVAMPRLFLSLLLAAFVATACESTTTKRGPTQGGVEERLDPQRSLERLERRVPAAGRTTKPPVLLESPAGEEPGDVAADPGPRGIRLVNVYTIADFLTAIIEDVDRYWTRTFTASGLAEPFVTYNWLLPGETVQMGCIQDGEYDVTNDDTAAYCPADDTIYVSQKFAGDLWEGLLRGRPQGVTIGDFGVAYVVAHEYAHNVQQELGTFQLDLATKQTELQADCLAGTWGNSAYRAGILEPGDPEEGINTAYILGDFDFLSPAHHGTPDERVEAWLLGYDTGEPAECSVYES
jgi:predicted metalloprotease